MSSKSSESKPRSKPPKPPKKFPSIGRRFTTRSSARISALAAWNPRTRRAYRGPPLVRGNRTAAGTKPLSAARPPSGAAPLCA